MPKFIALSCSLLAALAAPWVLAAATNPAVVATVSTPTPTPVKSGYDKPSQEILDVLRAPSPPRAQMSPTQERMLLVS